MCSIAILTKQFTLVELRHANGQDRLLQMVGLLPMRIGVLGAAGTFTQLLLIYSLGFKQKQPGHVCRVGLKAGPCSGCDQWLTQAGYLEGRCDDDGPPVHRDAARGAWHIGSR